MNSSSSYPHEVGRLLLNTVAFISSTIFVHGLVLVHKQREQRASVEAFALHCLSDNVPWLEAVGRAALG